MGMGSQMTNCWGQAPINMHAVSLRMWLTWLSTWRQQSHGCWCADLWSLPPVNLEQSHDKSSGLMLPRSPCKNQCSFMAEFNLLWLCCCCSIKASTAWPSAAAKITSTLQIPLDLQIQGYEAKIIMVRLFPFVSASNCFSGCMTSLKLQPWLQN